MNLKLADLRSEAKKTIKQEKIRLAIREELFRVFGPPIMVSGNLLDVIKATNEYLDLCEASGKDTRYPVKTNVLLEISKSKSSHARKLAVRLLPERIAVKFINDSEPSVRYSAAKRLSFQQIKEALKRHPGDDQLRSIMKLKKIKLNLKI